MARYHNLPLFKATMQLQVYLENTVKGFSRYHKYTIGTRLRETCWELLNLIIKANNALSQERYPLLVEVRDKAEELNLALILAKELQAFASYQSYEFAARLGHDIVKQCEGWRKSSKRPESSPRAPKRPQP